MNRLAEFCILATGWRRRFLSIAAGALAGLAMPPLGLPFMLVPGVALAVWLVDGAEGVSARPLLNRAQGWRAAAADGWFWGFGYHVAGLWWLGAAFLVEPEKFAWALPLGVFGLPAGLAIFSALGFALARVFWGPGVGRALVFAAAITATEALRGTILTGFPWNAPGMALGQSVVGAQAASLVGLWGLTLLALLIAALPAAMADPARQRLRFAPMAAAVVLALCVYGFGAWRTQAPPSPTLAGVKLRIMQPNVPQSARYDAETAAALVKDYLDLSDRATSPTAAGLADVTHLVWPESPFPFPLTSEPRMLAMIANALAGRTVLLTGGVHVEPDGRGGETAYNSLFALDRTGRIVDSYDKAHLVPFGEYLPFAGLLRRIGVRQFVSLPGGFTAGARRRAIEAPGLPLVQPLICYEAIFPGDVLPQGDARRPGLLVNVTNDAWFGATPGPWQHFAQARLRSVEEGIPMVRAANSGVSAVVDGYGRVVAQLDLGARGVLDSGAPRAISATLYARFTPAPAVALWLIVATLGAYLTFRGTHRVRR